MSSSAEFCSTIRQARYLPMFVALNHGEESSDVIYEQASKALYNIMQQSAENKQNRREVMVYKLISQLLQYCVSLKNYTNDALNPPTDSSEDVPTITQTVALLMKFSFNEEYRRAMCEFGALHTLAKLIETDNLVREGSVLNLPSESIAIRRYAAMALTNLTFRDSSNKALLCSFREFMQALVVQLQSPNEDLCQVTASVLRNLSWRADSCIKKVLRDIDAVTLLMKTALRVEKESTLKAVLSALWNLSAHSNLNKLDICRVDGAIEYLVKMLNYTAPSGTLVIVENVGGILRNISSSIAVRDDYRAIIRQQNCLSVLLEKLSSPSMTVVSNACGTLWNLSARCAEDQRMLISLKAIEKLRALTHSKNKNISVACSAALKNLTNARLDISIDMDDSRICDNSLLMRKRRNFDHDISDQPHESDSISDGNCKMISANKNYLDRVHNFGESSPCYSFVNFTARSEQEDLDKEVGRSSIIPPSCAESDSIHLSFADKGNNICNVRHSENENLSLKVFNRSDISTNNILSESNKLNGNDFMVYHKHNNSSSSDDDLNNSKTNGFRKCEEPYNIDDSFGNYAETDLDQTTNFSLRFHEQGRPDVERSEMQKKDVIDDCCTTLTVDASSDKNMPTVCAKMCDETPLMFSRSSSLDSVANCSPEVDDDHGSVVSDFSHGVSGVISPSELPASPSGTVPQSPRSVPRNSASQDETLIALPLKCETDASAFVNDDDDDDDGCEKVDCMDVNLSPEEEQAVLDACIDQGMPAVHRKFRSKTCDVTTDLIMSNHYVNITQSTTINDSTFNFCTEDTPISISHAASNSDLSLLCPSEDSFLQNSILPLSSCVDDHDIIAELPDEEQEKLLSLCIATGQSLNFNTGNSKVEIDKNMRKSLDESRSSHSSTLSEVTEDLPVEEERTLIKDMTESANLVITCSITENDHSFSPDAEDGELSDNESENLLNQCIALGIQNMKDSTDRTKELSDLENIGPPSFLAEANLDNSLTYVEEITDYPPCVSETLTPRQRRNQLKDRYNTYTVKLSPTKLASSISLESEKKIDPNKQHRVAEKDRFKTRTLSRGDFEEIVKSQQHSSPKLPRKTARSPKFPRKNVGADEPNHFLDSEGRQSETKIIKPAVPVKSGIPIVKSKPALSKNHDSVKTTPPNELPVVSLQRQNTFTKDEPSSIPVRKNLLTNNGNDKTVKPTTPTDALSPQFRSGIPSRIKEPSPKVVSRIHSAVADNSPDFSKNRWSVSENNLISSGVSKAKSNSNLNNSLNGNVPISHAFSSKLSPSGSQSALPIRKESTTRNISHFVASKK